MAPAGAIRIDMLALGGGVARFEPDEVTAKAGTVVFFLHNVPGALRKVDHNMLIGSTIYAEILARSVYVPSDKSAVFTVERLSPGTYTFWCQVGMHAQNGQVGALTITP